MADVPTIEVANQDGFMIRINASDLEEYRSMGFMTQEEHEMLATQHNAELIAADEASLAAAQAKLEADKV
jgi:hypothetical protein